MNNIFIPEIKKDVFYVGSKDWKRRMFDALIPLPNGTSYNSYLIKGESFNALIDTVNPGFEKELESKIHEIIGLENLDFIIMNHAEPDHAGAIEYLMKKNKKIKLILTQKGKEIAEKLFTLDQKRIVIKKSGDVLDLGNKQIEFIEAPFLHWPETMFSYLKEDKMLFSCDFFGAHTAYGTLETEVKNLSDEAKKYYGEIMMPYAVMAKAALKKLENYQLEMICPSHGPIYNEVETIINKYKKWTKAEPERKVLLVYVSMWNSTEKMMKKLYNELLDKEINVKIFSLETADIGEIIKELVDTNTLVLGTPTVLGKMHPLAFNALNLINLLKPPIKNVSLISSSGWSKGAVSQAKSMLALRNVKLIEPIDELGAPDEKLDKKIKEMSKKINELI